MYELFYLLIRFRVLLELWLEVFELFGLVLARLWVTVDLLSVIWGCFHFCLARI